MRLDPAQAADFRLALGHFASGLVVLTAPGPAGLTVQSLMSLSLAPPLVALGIDRRSRVWPTVSGPFCLNVLHAEQYELARRFGATGPDKFAGQHWRAAEDGVPELTEAHAWLRCGVHAQYDGGDHHLVVAEVCGLRLGSGEPLLFHRGHAGTFEKRMGRQGKSWTPAST
jgi:3-hydroxy-9,10-secoandrosta-1,3,5(10)-triene-9,17-dione monooxygenase reductase component